MFWTSGIWRTLKWIFDHIYLQYNFDLNLKGQNIYSSFHFLDFSIDLEFNVKSLPKKSKISLNQ